MASKRIAPTIGSDRVGEPEVPAWDRFLMGEDCWDELTPEQQTYWNKTKGKKLARG